MCSVQSRVFLQLHSIEIQTGSKDYLHLALEQFSKDYSIHLQFSDKPRTRTIEFMSILLEAVYHIFIQRSFCTLLANQLYSADQLPLGFGCGCSVFLLDFVLVTDGLLMRHTTCRCQCRKLYPIKNSGPECHGQCVYHIVHST